MKKKTLALLLACCLAIGVAAGGTLAWLTDSTSEVKNTFTSADIGVTLIETKKPDGTEVAAGVTDWAAQMIPGYTYSKNPTVTVKANSVDCYLFVKFAENNNPSTYLTYTSNLTAENGWTKLTDVEGVNNVWYREVTSSTSDQFWKLLANDTISVKDTVTKQNMTDAAKAELVYTAYVCQLYSTNNQKFDVATAWTNAQPAT